MWRGFVGSCWLGPGYPVLRADTRENPVGKNGVMTVGAMTVGASVEDKDATWHSRGTMPRGT